ncbi:MAG: hypothetical protein Q9222_000722 [Ikaeria aurantiellina]
MRIAIEGCGHGTLHAIYASVKATCQIRGWDGVDLLIIGGDFQAVRNSFDLNAMSVPAKYRAIGDFHEYYSGARVAHYLTLFVGGNHEASNHLWELYYGGWVAPNIYYLGAANVVNLGPLRIAGLSGIWKAHDFKKPHFERLPYRPDQVKSIYHVRELDTRKLLQLRTQVDIGISHDWPKGIEWKGNWEQLFRFKPHFVADAKSGRLGSLAAKDVMDRLRPKWWFAAHLHCKFSAVIQHGQHAPTEPLGDASQGEPSHDTGDLHDTNEIDLETDKTQSSKEEMIDSSMGLHNNDEIDLDIDDEASEDLAVPVNSDNLSPPTVETPMDADVVPSDLREQLPASFARPTPTSEARLPYPEAIMNRTTHFLALDKCLPQRRFLQLLEIDPISNSSSAISSTPYRFTYDKEWLAITRAFASVSPLTSPVPHNQGEAYYRSLIEAEEAWVEENVIKTGKFDIPKNFQITAPTYDPSVGLHPKDHPMEYTNPQTAAFCRMLGITNFFDASEEQREARRVNGPPVASDGGRGGGGRGRGRGFRSRGGGGSGGRARGNRHM